MRKFFVLFIGLALLCQAKGIGQTITENPAVDDASMSYVTIKRVEITDEFTKVYLHFRNEQKTLNLPDLPPLFRDSSLTSSSSNIWIDPNTRLYEPGITDKKYQFIKAEGIPTDPERHEVAKNEEINFVVYFEPLPPGLEVFDFYEGRPRSPNEQTWNFFGVHIKNPEKATPERKKKVPKTSPPRPNAEIAAKADPKGGGNRQPEPPTQIPAEKSTTEGNSKAALSAKNISLSGRVFNANSGKLIPAQITYSRRGTSSKTSTADGDYTLNLANDTSYRLNISSPGFMDVLVIVDPLDSMGKNDLRHDIFLIPMTKGSSFRMDDIYFETSKYDLLPESFEALDRLVNTLKSNPQVRISIQGHTENIGDFDKNVQLSRDRSGAVKEYLVKNGVDPSRIESRGYGSTRPAEDASGEKDGRKNRRVEIVVIDS